MNEGRVGSSFDVSLGSTEDGLSAREVAENFQASVARSSDGHIAETVGNIPEVESSQDRVMTNCNT
jgi:hypothetical protein